MIAVKLFVRLCKAIRCYVGLHQVRTTSAVFARRTHWPVRTKCSDCGRELIIQPNGAIEEAQ